MTWDCEKTTTPVAKKDYHCDASEFIGNASYPDEDYEPEDLAIIEQAKKENNKIKLGTKYIKTKGLWEGEWSVFRARIDLDEICRKYGLYPDA